MPNEKTPEELKAEHVGELERQLKFLKENAVDWKKTHPERWEEDVKRLEDELAKLQPKEEKAPEVVGALKADKPRRGRPPTNPQ